MAAFDQTGSQRSFSLLVGEPTTVLSQALSHSFEAGGIKTVHRAQTSGEVEQMVQALQPTGVLLEERLAMNCVPKISHSVPVTLRKTRIAVFADYLTDCQLDLMLHNEISAFLSRHDDLFRLCEHIIRIAAGQRIVSQHMDSRLELVEGRFVSHVSSFIRDISPKQYEVLIRVAQGKKPAVVASELSLTPKAVESHKYRLMKSVGVDNQVELCRWAIREGLIDA